jgi:hypothetical protein
MIYIIDFIHALEKASPSRLYIGEFEQIDITKYKDKYGDRYKRISHHFWGDYKIVSPGLIYRKFNKISYTILDLPLIAENGEFRTQYEHLRVEYIGGIPHIATYVLDDVHNNIIQHNDISRIFAKIFENNHVDYEIFYTKDKDNDNVFICSMRTDDYIKSILKEYLDEYYIGIYRHGSLYNIDIMDISNMGINII